MKRFLLTTIVAVLLVGCKTPQPKIVQAPGISFWDAAETGNIEAVKQHLAVGVDMNIKDKQYRATALHWATWCGHKEIAELLIVKGADVNEINVDGDTPLDLAIQFSQTEHTALLRKYGGKMSAELQPEEKK